MTPLQTLIARKIISMYPEQKFDVVFLAENDNKKHIYYYEKIQEKSCDSYFFNREKTIRKKGRYKKYKVLFSLFRLIREIKQKNYHNVYLANINQKDVYWILSKINFDNIFTFDDGVTNISTSSTFHKSLKFKSFTYKVLKILDKIDVDRDYILTNLKGHYTIYPGFPNITDKLIPISLFDDIKNIATIDKPSVKIFIGQPITRGDFGYETINEILSNFQIDFYFPHPSEENVSLSFQLIKTNLIFEEYLNELLSQYNYIEIYTLCSAVALNIQQSDKIKIFGLYTQSLLIKRYDLYEIFQRKGITLINIESNEIQ